MRIAVVVEDAGRLGAALGEEGVECRLEPDPLLTGVLDRSCAGVGRAVEDGRQSQAANYAQLRKVLCLDARSMEQASALGLQDDTFDQAA